MDIFSRAPREGCCNICGVVGLLTHDHVPPQGSVDPKRMRIQTLAASFEPVHPRIAHLTQNGVKFRSLCDQCNTQRLGNRYDPFLNRFSRKIAQILRVRDRVILPAVVMVECNPQRLARAVVGHLLAAEIREDMTAPLTSAPMIDDMRAYFLDEGADFPCDLHLYFWPYASARQAIFRGMGILSAGQVVVGDFLKYFPVAFWLAHRLPTLVIDRMRDREIPVRRYGIDECFLLRVPTSPTNTFRHDWPERPDDQEILVLNDSVCLLAEGA
jgi:hypothetical protein